MLPMLFMLTACPNPPPPQKSCNFVQNSFQRRVSWARLPVRFYVDKGSFAGADEDKFYNSMKEAMQVWNDALGFEALVLIGRTTELPAPQLNGEGRVIPDGYNAIYRVEKDVFDNSSTKDEQARTSISFKGDYIYEADVLVDASELFYFEDEAIQASEGRVQFKSLMIHEFGHVLGLGHVEDSSVGSVMYPKLMFGEMRPAPLYTKSADGQEVESLQLPAFDRQSLSCEYQEKI